MASIALRFLPHLVVLVLIITGGLYVRHLQEKVTKQEVILSQKEEEISLLKAQVDNLSMARSALDTALREAEVEREKVRGDLQAVLRKLRNQKPPIECKAAVEWAVENKGDLKWDGK